ncbi:hypothetical protein LguiB_019928 [Lonicera macranthoides]
MLAKTSICIHHHSKSKLVVHRKGTMYLCYLPPLLLLLLLLALYVLTYRLLHKLQNLPPTPFPNLPLIGHLYLLNKPFHKSISTLSYRYGPVFSLQFGSRSVLIVSSPSAAEECFTKKNDVVFANRPHLLIGKYFGYNYTSLAWAPYGDHWRNLRRISSLELLSSHRLKLLSRIRADEVLSLTRRLFKISNDCLDRTVELKSAFFELTFNVMMRMMAGSITEEAKRFHEMVMETSVVAEESTIADFLPSVALLRGIKVEKKLREIHEKRDNFMQGLIERHRQLGFQFDDIPSPRRKNTSMIQILLSLQQTDPDYYTDQTIKSLLLVLLQAGTDTSVGTMEWAMSNLLNHPQVLKKAQTEINNNVGQERLIDESDLNDLPYLDCIINETLRMHPPTPLLVPHESSEDCTVGGFRIPRGTMLFVNLWGIQNDPKNWVDPQRFNPDRFLEIGVDRAKEGFKLMPFGSGRRGCPGERLAIRMVGLALGSLIQCFDWERIGTEMVDMTAGTGVTVSKAIPLMAKCWPRPTLANLLSQI